MEKPHCYIPESFKGFYDSISSKEDLTISTDKTKVIGAILSIYLDYRCLATVHNDREPDDPAGLGILEMICLKLICNPRHTGHIRQVYANLDDLYDQIVQKGIQIDRVLDTTFTLEELIDYGF